MTFLSSSLSGLIQWCRALRHGLGAGLSLVKVFQTQAKKGPRGLREMAGRIAQRLEKGDALEDALEAEGEKLPKLFRELAGVGERTGHLPEIFVELGEYYEMQQKLGREFRSQLVWPVFTFTAAVLIIAFLIFVLGMISEGRGTDAPAPIGFGLRGAKGAIIFLMAVATVLGGLFGLYLFLTRGVRQKAAFENFLLRLPAVGPCADAFAMGRFCLALRMTMETGMPVHDAVRQSLRATGNAAFTNSEPYVVSRLKAGDEVNVALRQCPAFTPEFLDILEVSEVSGQIPEVMARQAEFYREEAARRLKGLTRFANFAIYGIVSLLIIFAIFRIASLYLSAVSQV